MKRDGVLPGHVTQLVKEAQHHLHARGPGTTAKKCCQHVLVLCRAAFSRLLVGLQPLFAPARSAMLEKLAMQNPCRNDFPLALYALPNRSHQFRLPFNRSDTKPSEDNTDVSNMSRGVPPRYYISQLYLSSLNSIRKDSLKRLGARSIVAFLTPTAEVRVC